MSEKDYNGLFFYFSRLIILKLKKYYFSWITVLLIRLKGIKCGNKLAFFGFPYFYRFVNSKIIIEDNCTFRSDHCSNLIGVNRKCIISTHHRDAEISIGKNSGFSGVSIGAYKSITIGEHVLCGANVLITDFDWHINDPRSGNPKPIIIKNNVWIGEGSKILKGVIIGENSVIGAGSVVTKSIPENVIAAGNPCVVIKKIDKVY